MKKIVSEKILKVKKWSPLFLCLAVLLFLSACNTNGENGEGNRGNPTNSEFEATIDNGASSFADDTFEENSVMGIALPEEFIRETEPNDEPLKATSIEVNKKIVGNFEASNDADWYRFNMETKGSVVIRFLGNESIRGNGYFKIYTEKEVATINPLNFEFGTGETYQLNSDLQVRLPADTYYIRIYSDLLNAYTDKEYSFAVYFKAEGDGYETEPNNLYYGNIRDEREEANDIPFNKKIIGSLVSYFYSNEGDNDYFKVTVPKDGILQVEYEYENKSGGIAYIRIKSVDNNNQQSLPTAMEKQGKTEKFRVSAGEYYIQVFGGLVSTDRIYNGEYSIIALFE